MSFADPNNQKSCGQTQPDQRPVVFQGGAGEAATKKGGATALNGMGSSLWGIRMYTDAYMYHF